MRPPSQSTGGCDHRIGDKSYPIHDIIHVCSARLCCKMLLCLRKEALASHHHHRSSPPPSPLFITPTQTNTATLSNRRPFEDFPLVTPGGFSSLSGCRSFFYFSGHPNFEPGACAGLRFDHQPAADRLCPFRSAGKPVMSLADQIEPARG